MKSKINYLLIVLLTIVFVAACTTKSNDIEQEQWSVKLADSEIKRFPNAWMIEKTKKPKWGYTHGCVVKAMLDLYDHTADSTYYYYAKGYVDKLIHEGGKIDTYQMDKYNIDNINAGKVLFRFYADTKDERYKQAIDTLFLQMEKQPRTSEGGYWHKQIYPHQMWLDGLYMAEPFLANYAVTNNQPELFDDIILQFKLMDKNSYDPETNLFYHGWDESKEQAWADKTTGRSPNFWLRSIGWYAMAAVDVLDFLPKDHKDRDYLIDLVNRQAKGAAQWQDSLSGVWYQIPNLPNREGNYLESSGSAMFVAFLYKAARNGYIDNCYIAVADKGFEGIMNQFIQPEEDGTYSITNCCAVGGLGGTPRYRDGSFEYYMSEPVILNDPKSVAPFIWAAIEHEKKK